jgi:hypothetical protein
VVVEQTGAGRAPSLSTRRKNGTRRASGALALDQSLMPQECSERRGGSLRRRPAPGHMRAPARPNSSVSQSPPYCRPLAGACGSDMNISPTPTGG